MGDITTETQVKLYNNYTLIHRIDIFHKNSWKMSFFNLLIYHHKVSGETSIECWIMRDGAIRQEDMGRVLG